MRRQLEITQKPTTKKNQIKQKREIHSGEGGREGGREGKRVERKWGRRKKGEKDKYPVKNRKNKQRKSSVP